MATAKAKDIRVSCPPKVVWDLCLEYFGSTEGWELAEVDERKATLVAKRGATAGDRFGAFLRGGATGIGVIKAARAKGLQLYVKLEPGGVLSPSDTFVRVASAKDGTFDPGGDNQQVVDSFEAWMADRVAQAVRSGESTAGQWRPNI